MRILYLNSFYRSGETLMLRCLNEHPEIKVLHNIFDRSNEVKLQYDIFKKIKFNKPDIIELSIKEKSILRITDEKILLVKNGAFEVKRRHFGFGLIRNPFSVYASYLKINSDIDSKAQMKRWAKSIDKYLINFIDKSDFIDAFCASYNCKMGGILRSKQPIILYENFISNPELELKSLLGMLNLEWDENVLNSHKKYPVGMRGHGGILLNEPIKSRSNKLPKLSDDEKYRIYAWTSNLMISYGYKIDLEQNKIEINAN